MNEVERSELERKLEKKLLSVGYEHPDGVVDAGTNNPVYNPYSSYNAKGKDVYTKSTTSNYATYEENLDCYLNDIPKYKILRDKVINY